MGSLKKGRLNEYFNLEGHVASTRSADAYNAFSKERGISVCLWMLRHPLSQNSDASERFLSRLAQLKELKSPHIQILDYGIDASGMAWAAVPALDGSQISLGNRDITEMERRFTAAVRLVEKLHINGIVCGDLSAASFWVNRNGDVLLAGVMGSFDTEAAATAVMPPMDTLCFVSPEQRAGGSVEPASDVFALGVLGYLMLTGQYPFGDSPMVYAGELDISKLASVASLVQNPPVWAEEVLRRCLQPGPESRYPSASAVLQGMADARQRVISQAEMPTLRARKDVIIKKPTSGVESYKGQQASADSKQEAQPESTTTDVLSPKFLLFALTVFIMVVLGAFFVISSKRQPSASQVPQVQETVKIPSQQLQPPPKYLQEQSRKLAEQVISGDPMAHEILVKSAVEAQSPEVRGLAEKALVDRVRRLGFQRTAEQLRQWLRTVPVDSVPQAYEPLLRSLNTGVPQAARDRALREAYAGEPAVALRFAAALALDAQNPEEYRDVFSQMAGDSMNMEDASKHSVLGLILAHPELSLVFGEDVVQRKNMIPADDLVWLLKVLGDRNDFNVRGFASMAAEGNVLSPGRKYVLNLISQREDLSPEIMNLLVRIGSGALKKGELGAFGRWFDLQSEKVLYIIMADYKDPAITGEAFDYLAGKSLSQQPGAALIPIVQRDYAEKKLEAGPVIGMLSMLEIYSLDDVLNRMSVFDSLARDGRVTNVLMKSEDPRLARIVLERYSNKLSTPTLIELLEHPDPQIRIAAVKALKGQNDISVLKLILDQHEKEKNPEVLKVYKATFWMLSGK